MEKDTEVERLTQQIGRELFTRMDRPGPVPFGPTWWEDRLMEWTMGDEQLKLQLFRFVDVLPMLQTAPAIAGHLREYFNEAREHLPGWMSAGLRWLPRDGVLPRLLAFLARTSARQLARKFIAGSNIEEAREAVARMRGRELAFTVDLLGEATITDAEADAHLKEYLHLISGLSQVVNRWPAQERIDHDHVGNPLPRVNVSVKLSSLDSQFDPIDPVGTIRSVLTRLRPILRSAQEHQAFVNIDMEQYVGKDLTLRIFKEVLMEEEFRHWPDVGVALQAYLKDTEDDVRDLLSWVQERGTSVWVRLVKGAYWDYETIMAGQQGWPCPVWTQKWESDACYERLTRVLIENHGWLRPAFGSHNVRSLAHALAIARVLGLPERTIEIQMLYGMAHPLQDALVRMGQRVRVYTPYGELLPGMAYLVRRLLENTANESFLRASFTENVPEEELLMSPTHTSTLHGQLAQTGGKSASTEQNGGVLQCPSRSRTTPFCDGHCQSTNEPLTDFSNRGALQTMQSAIAQVAGELGKTYPLVIGGSRVDTTDHIVSVNPSHKQQVVGRCGRASVEHAQQAIELAQRAFPGWRDTPAQRRAQYLFDAAEVMQRRRFELAAWQIHESGKQWREADGDVAEAMDFCRFYAREMLRLAQPRVRNVPGEDNSHGYEPRGVTVVISPWNFPLAILCGMTSAGLVTGNPVIMKPAEQSSVMAAKLMEVYEEVGLPAGVLQYLPGIGEEVGPTLVQHRDVAVIAFTGSRGVGLTINRQAADLQPEQDHVKRVLAEMGGKNAIIVDDDADLDEAVHGVALSAFIYQGQKCSACSRVIVSESLHDTFLARLIEATRSLQVGPAEDPGSVVSAVIDEEAYNRIRATIGQGKGEGKLVYAGEVGSLAEEGYYIAPHIFADVSPESSLATEEIFGPVLVVLKSRDLTHALEIANGTRYALTGGFYSRSPQNIERVKREFRVGNLYINRKITGAFVDRQPFGGFKLSGIGAKAGGPDYLVQFMVPRTITENTLRRGFAPET